MQLAPALSVTPAGSESETLVSVASEGPALVATIVYVAPPPGVYVVLPSVFVTLSAACAESPSLSEPLPLAPDAASFAVAELTSGSSARSGANATGAVNTSVLPPPATIVAPLAPKLVSPPAPVTVPQLELPLAAQRTSALNVTPVGSASLTETSSASLEPVLATVIVYVAVPPGV